VVAVALLAIGLWILARSEPGEAALDEGPVDEGAQPGAIAADPPIAYARAAPQSLPPPEDDGTTMGEGAAPATRQASLSSEMSADLEVDLDEPGTDEEEPTGPVPLILVSAVGRTDQGRRRKHNEDAFAVDGDRGLFAIADGMGGYAAGEVASQMAIDTLVGAYREQDFGGSPIPGLPRRGDELVRAIQTANQAILSQARANEAQAGMGTTIVAARFSPNRQRVYIAHVGDSRVYRIRDHQLHQLTADHTLGAAGVTGPSAAKLSRAVGVFDEVEVDLNVDEPRVGDYYLLCSDGLFKMVPENDIQRLVEGEKDLSVTANRLVDEANARGGKDNVSVIVVRVDEPQLRA
jgi:serine/threonine protein phosphatase PrpC